MSVFKRLRAGEKKYAAWFANGLNATGSAAVAHFLDAVDYRLLTLTPDTRLDIRNELRQHIESLKAAHEELGEDRGEAISSALHQVGDPQEIARRFCRAWAETVKESVWTATRAALKLTAGTLLFFLVIATLVLPHLHFSLEIESVITWPAVSVLPMLVGAQIGLRFPRRGASATFYATSIVALAAAPVLYYGLRFGCPTAD